MLSYVLLPSNNLCKSMKKPGLPLGKPGLVVEAAGIAPASREASVRASTCVVVYLVVGIKAPSDRVPFSLARYKFNPDCNKRLGPGYPELTSSAGSLGRRAVAKQPLFFRQRGCRQVCSCQLNFGPLFTRPADQPRHATVHFGHPVDPGSPPVSQSCEPGLAHISYYSTLHPDVKQLRKRRLTN